MISNRVVLALAIAALVVLASPAAAQYMYLDANGNSVHDSGDRLAPNGTPTTVDVWLVTDHNRDGSPVVCSQDSGTQMSINSYVVNLEASGGTVSYGGFVTHFGSYAFGELNPGDGLRYKNGFGQILGASPPGTYRICTLTITSLTAIPQIRIVDQVSGSADFTSFGTGAGGCFGNDFDNTMKLAGPHGGSDWSDVDGLTSFPTEVGPPVLAAIGNKTVNEGDCLTFTATGTAPDGSPVSFFLGPGQPPLGASITTGGQFTWCPTEDQGPGTYAVTVTAVDNVTQLIDSETIQVTVNEVNLAPVLTAIGDKTVIAGNTLTFTATATDADLPANARTFSLDPVAPEGATIHPTTGLFSWTPAVEGSFPVTVRVTDSGSPPLSDVKSFTIAVIHDETPPVVQNPGDMTVTAGSTLDRTVTAFDSDGQPLTFSKSASSPPFMTVTTTGPTTGNIHLAPPVATGAGLYGGTVIASNGSMTGSATFTIAVAPASGVFLFPINMRLAVVNEGMCMNLTATALTAGGGPATFSLVAGAPAGATITPGGQFSWCPTEAQGPGSYPITICATEVASGLSDCKTFTATVHEVNLPPVLDPIGNKTALLGGVLTFTATATDPDLPANALTFSLTVDIPPGASINPATGVFTWTPVAFGTFPITIQVTDNQTPPLNDSETFLVVVGQGSPPVLNPIADMTVNEGTVGTQTISASDPDNQSLQFSKQSGPFWVSIQTVGPTTGLVTASPDLSAGGTSYPVTAYVTDGLFSDQRAFLVQVTENCSPPVADAGGPYSGVTWFPVTFDGTGSTDPDGDIQAYGWDFGDGLTASGATVMHAYLQPGTYTVVLYVSDVCSGGSDSDQTTVTISDCYSTLAFVAGGNKQINLLNEKPTWCVQLEPFGGTFDVATIDPSSLVMRSTGTGAVSEIHALTDKTSVGGDRNGNGYTELSACFRKEDLRQLFSGVTGTQQVQVTFEGNLLVGGRTCSSLTIAVKGSGAALAASISPNPLNPSAVLTFTTQERGTVLVQLFDVRGRLLRTLRDEADAAAGYHDVRIDGTTANGTRLSSGIYYIRIRAGAEEERRTITILK